MKMNCYEFYEKYIHFLAVDKPNIDWNIWKIFWFYTRRAFFFICISYAFISSILVIFFREQIVVTEIGFQIIDISAYYISLFRLIYAVYHNDNIHKIIDQMNAFKSSADTNFGKDVTISSAIIRARNIQIISIVFVTTCVAIMHSGEISSELSSQHSYYEITLIYEMVMRQIHGLNYINLDVFFFATVLLTNQQLNILASNLKNVLYTSLVDAGCDVKDVQDLKQNVESPKLIKIQDLTKPEILRLINGQTFSTILRNNFGKCVRHHQQLTEIIDRLQNVISLSSFLQCICTTYYLMFSLFAIVGFDDKAVKMNAFAYLYGTLSQISCLCICGQTLSSKFIELRTVATEMPWYLIPDKSFRLSNIILMLKLNQPYKLAAGPFFDLTHEMLLQIYRTAFSYFTVLRQLTSI